jgi:hypothetical protein
MRFQMPHLRQFTGRKGVRRRQRLLIRATYANSISVSAKLLATPTTEPTSLSRRGARDAGWCRSAADPDVVSHAPDA